MAFSDLAFGKGRFALTTVVVAAEEEERLSPAADGEEEDMAPAPYDDDEIVEEFEGLCMLFGSVQQNVQTCKIILTFIKSIVKDNRRLYNLGLNEPFK